MSTNIYVVALETIAYAVYRDGTLVAEIDRVDVPRGPDGSSVASFALRLITAYVPSEAVGLFFDDGLPADWTGFPEAEADIPAGAFRP